MPTKRLVALLDVDETLSMCRDDSLNDNLVNALIKSGVKDAYLFTDMTFNSDDLDHRNKIIQYLEGFGMVVHGVITPADCNWHIDDDVLNAFVQEFEEKKIDLRSNLNLAHLDAMFKSYKDMFSDKNYKKLGHPFAESIEAQSDHVLSDQNEHTRFNNKSRNCKLITEITSIYQKLDHSKGLMFERFIHEKTPFTGCLIFDDREECLSAVAAVSKLYQLPTATFLVPKKNLSEDEYLMQIEQSKPYMIDKINKQIAILKSRSFSIFFASNEAKIRALKILREAISAPYYYPDTNSIKDIVDAWLNDTTKFKKDGINVPISEVIDSHRNIFFSSEREKVTATREFVNSIINKIN